jgi:hypothetical protein
MFGVVTVAAGLACLAGALVIATFGGMQWPRVAYALMLTGITGILNGTVGGLIHREVTNVDHMLGGFIGRFTGAAITGLASLIVLSIAGLWVYQRNDNRRTLAMVGAVPATVSLIPGAAGTVATTVVGALPALIAAVIHATLGW